MESLTAQKTALRRTLKENRNAIPEEVRMAEDKAIAGIFLGTEMYENARFILSYVSYGSEVDTKEIIRQAIKDRKEVYVPRMLETIQGRKMEFFKCEDLGSLSRSSMGILEPAVDPAHVFPYHTHLSLDRAEECVILVPGLAFDKNLNRIGYGGGYYDRYLAHFTKKFAIGLAYREQIIDSVPMDENDRQVDLVLTSEQAYL